MEAASRQNQMNEKMGSTAKKRRRESRGACRCSDRDVRAIGMGNIYSDELLGASPGAGCCTV